MIKVKNVFRDKAKFPLLCKIEASMCVCVQRQFNLFVLNLRQQYGSKVKTFRQVIEVHRLELQQKQQYWDEALAVSMSVQVTRSTFGELHWNVSDETTQGSGQGAGHSMENFSWNKVIGGLIVDVVIKERFPCYLQEIYDPDVRTQVSRCS